MTLPARHLIEEGGGLIVDLHVKPNEHEQWSVVDRGDADRVVGTEATKGDAEQIARKLIGQVGGGSLTLYSKDGKPQDPVQVRGD